MAAWLCGRAGRTTALRGLTAVRGRRLPHPRRTQPHHTRRMPSGWTGGEDERDTRARQRLSRRAAVHAARTAGRLAGGDGAAQPKVESSDRLRAQLRIACCAHALSHNELVTVLA